MNIKSVDKSKREKININVRSELLRNEALRVVELKKSKLHKRTGKSLEMCHQGQQRNTNQNNNNSNNNNNNKKETREKVPLK